MIGRLLAIMFLSRELAHRMHLKTGSYAEHVALGSFYTEIIGLADSIAEMYQGRNGVIKEIPLLEDEDDMDDPVEVLTRHLDWLEKIRYTAVEKSETAIQNEIDTVVGLYLSTLYKLKRLK
jgi:hypothetical protein